MKGIIRKIKNIIKDTDGNTQADSNKKIETITDEQAYVLKLFNVKVPENLPESIPRELTADAGAKALEAISSGDLMDTKTLIDFDKKVLSLKYISHPEITPGNINIDNIPALLCKNKKYMEILRDNERIHSPERARLKVLFNQCIKNNSNIDGVLDEMSASFNNIASSIKNPKYLNIVWVKYLNLAAQYTGTVPKALLEYITIDTYRPAFCLLKNYIERKEFCTDCNEAKNSASQAKLVCNRILRDIDTEDVPSLMLLGKLFQAEGDYENAEKFFSIIANREDGFNGVTALADCYSANIAELRKQANNSYDKRSCWIKIDEINEKQVAFLKNHLYHLAKKINASEDNYEDKRNYVALTCRYARLEKSVGKYMHCSIILDNVPADYPEYHRVLLENGMLCQHRGKDRYPNEFYNLQKAAKYFEDAARQIEKEQMTEFSYKKSMKSALVPLANTLYMLNRYDEAKNICVKVLKIDSTECNIISLMKRIADAEELTIPA